jgi:hypothetical protein
MNPMLYLLSTTCVHPCYSPYTPVTEPTNYTKLSKKIIHPADDLTNLSPYNPVVHEITTDFKPTYMPAKIVIGLVVTICRCSDPRGS